MTDHESNNPSSGNNAWVKGAVALVQRMAPTPHEVPALRAAYRPTARPRTLHLVFALSAVFAMVIIAVASLRGRDQALTFEVVSGIRLPADEPTIVGGTESALLRFSDGTTAALVPGARGRVRGLLPHGARLAIDVGKADIDVVHREKTAWVVEAGPYTIRVTGTRFSVAWDPTAAVFDLHMRAGSVEVVGPYITSTAVVTGGQHLNIRASDGFRNVDVPAPTSVPADVKPPEEAPRPQPAMKKVSVPTTPAIAALTAAGNYEAAVQAALSTGPSKLCRAAPAAELVALADAARYTRRIDLAAQALKAVRSRWPRSAVASEAAFMLGTMAEDVQQQPVQATKWYGAYLREMPRGRYASESLGRSMVLRQQEQGNRGAKVQAQQYIEAFPAGTYAGVARRILLSP